MRPVLAGIASLREMQDCTYDLWDVQLLNDALDAEAENNYRARKALEDQ
jgi:hypothetical protein